MLASALRPLVYARRSCTTLALMDNFHAVTRRRRALAIWSLIAFVGLPCWFHVLLHWRIYFPKVTHYVCVVLAVIIFVAVRKFIAPHLLRLIGTPVPTGVTEQIIRWGLGAGLTYGWLLLFAAVAAPIVGGEWGRRLFRAVQVEECTAKCFGCRNRAVVELWGGATTTLCIERAGVGDSIEVEGLFSRVVVFFVSARVAK